MKTTKTARRFAEYLVDTHAAESGAEFETYEAREAEVRYATKIVAILLKIDPCATIEDMAFEYAIGYSA